MQKQLNKLWDVFGFGWVFLVAFIIFLATGVELSFSITSNQDKLPPGWSIVTDGSGYYAPRSDRDGIVHIDLAEKDSNCVRRQIFTMNEYYYRPSPETEPSNVWHVAGGTNK